MFRADIREALPVPGEGQAVSRSMRKKRRQLLRPAGEAAGEEGGETTMPLRKCPGCGEIRYSAYGGAWRCDVCGVTVGKEHDITERRETNAATGKFRR